MDDIDALLSIGAFAQRVGLAPSALRFYDDCGVLRPAHVDDATGYRYYRPEQEPRAVLVRRLRKAGMPLTEASVVLDGTREQALAALEEHARRTQDSADTALSAIEEILWDLSAGAPGVVARVGGAEFSSAIRQVVSAVAPTAIAEEFPVLGGVLIELDGQEVRLVATDRFRLALRTLRPHSLTGRPHHAVVGACALEDLIPWAMRLGEVDLEFTGRTARIHGGGQSRRLPTIKGEFPDYRMILDHLPTTRNRLITARKPLRDRLADGGGDGPVALLADAHGLAVEGSGAVLTTLPAICTGPSLRIAFDPAVLLAAVDAAVGPDVLLEIASETQPVVVRSADQGSFTTLVMPVRGTTAEDHDSSARHPHNHNPPHQKKIMNTDDPVVQLCSQGMQAEAEGRDVDARTAFERAWKIAADDYQACVAAHYLARHQPTPQETLRWNKECLDRADRVSDDRVKGFYASLHLNMAKAHMDLADPEQARRHFEQAAARVDELPDGRYADWTRFAIGEGLRSSGATAPRAADDLLKDLLARFCARADLKALGLIVPAYLADLGTKEDQMRLLTALHMLHAARSLPSDEQKALGQAIGSLNGDTRTS